jgi:hypothetical protein
MSSPSQPLSLHMDNARRVGTLIALRASVGGDNGRAFYSRHNMDARETSVVTQKCDRFPPHYQPEDSHPMTPNESYQQVGGLVVIRPCSEKWVSIQS